MSLIRALSSRISFLFRSFTAHSLEEKRPFAFFEKERDDVKIPVFASIDGGFARQERFQKAVVPSMTLNSDERLYGTPYWFAILKSQYGGGN